MLSIVYPIVLNPNNNPCCLFQLSATFLASQKSLPIVTSLFLVSAVSSRCQLKTNDDEESLEGKTISKKNQALIKVRILNLREEKKNMRIELSMDLKMKEKIQN